MKTIRIIILSIFVSVALLLSNSCCDSYDYEWTFYFAENLDSTNVYSGDSIKKENYGINLQLFHRKYYTNIQTPFINKAYATQCYEDYYNRDSIVDIKITSLRKFNSEHDSLSNVTDLFESLYIYYDYDSTLNITQYIRSLNKNRNSMVNDISFKLATEEVYTKKHQFKIEIELSDNRIMEDTTKTIILY